MLVGLRFEMIVGGLRQGVGRRSREGHGNSEYHEEEEEGEGGPRSPKESTRCSFEFWFFSAHFAAEMECGAAAALDPLHRI